MDLPTPLDLIHQPTRLAIMGYLWRHRDVSARILRRHLSLTDGNLATHAKRLEAAGLLAPRNALGADGFQVRYRITPEGHAAFRDYLGALQAFLADATV